MTYRGPDKTRIHNQMHADVLMHAGQTAIWRQYISASAGVSVAGFGSALSYREQLITALFKSTVGLTLTQPEFQTPGGMTLDADFIVVTRQQLHRQDELTWAGSNWRIESDSQPSRMNGTWINILRRGD